MKTLRIYRLLASAWLLGASFSLMAQVTSPLQAFGFEPGTDRKLADWVELTSYYRKVAAESGRVKYEEIGKTMEVFPFCSEAEEPALALSSSRAASLSV